MAKNKNNSPKNVTKIGEPATSDGTWKRYKTSTTGKDTKTGFEDPLKGYPYNNGKNGRKIIGFIDWTGDQTSKKNK